MSKPKPNEVYRSLSVPVLNFAKVQSVDVLRESLQGYSSLSSLLSFFLVFILILLLQSGSKEVQ